MFIVVIGDPVTGFTYHGPFEDMETACDYGERESPHEWWLARLAAPK